MAARLPYLDREHVPPEIQEAYDGLRQATGRVLNIFRLMAHHARSLPPFLRWYPTLREGALTSGSGNSPTCAPPSSTAAAIESHTTRPSVRGSVSRARS